MRWFKRGLIGLVSTLAVTYAVLAFITREPTRPVVTLPRAGKLMLVGVTVVDPRTGALQPGMTVLMDAGKIVRVAADAPVVGADVQRVDATGKFVVPGFNDMHAHPLNNADPSGDFALMLANGITGFRQMSGSDAMLRNRAERRLSITADAPALLALPGPLLTPLTASKPEQARETIRRQHAAGADFVKTAFVSEPVLIAALDEARRLGIPLDGHVPGGMEVASAAAKGMRAIEHLGASNGLLFSCSSRGKAILANVASTTATPTVPAFNSRIIAKLAEWSFAKLVINPTAADHDMGGVAPTRAALASFDEARCRRQIALINTAGSWHVPTLIRLKTIYTAADPVFARDPNLRYMPADTVEKWREVTASFTATYSPAERDVLRASYLASLRIVKLLDQQGTRMLAGSDASGSGWEVPGFALHRELDELARAGLSPLRILQMTTIDAAEFLGRTATMGSVAAGRNADLVLLDADPTKDVANLHRVAGVVRGGFYHDAARLAALQERVAQGRGYLR